MLEGSFQVSTMAGTAEKAASYANMHWCKGFIQKPHKQGTKLTADRPCTWLEAFISLPK